MRDTDLADPAAPPTPAPAPDARDAPDAATTAPRLEEPRSALTRSLPPLLAALCLIVLLVVDLCGPASAGAFPLPADAKIAAAIADLDGADAEHVAFERLASFPCAWPRGGEAIRWSDVVPDEVKQLEGRRVGIVGWSIPLQLDGVNVRSFLLSHVHPSCCFGGLPQPNELITVSLPVGDELEYDAHTPVVAVGTLVIDDAPTSNMSGVYTLRDARAVRVPLD